MTDKIVTGVTAGGPLSAAIAAALAAFGLITGRAGTAVGAAFGAAFALKIAQIKMVHSHKGVYWPLSNFLPNHPLSAV